MSFQEWLYVNEAYTVCLALMSFILGFLVVGGFELVRLFFAFVFEKTKKKESQGAHNQED